MARQETNSIRDNDAKRAADARTAALPPCVARSLRHRRAFTLTEVLVTIGLIVVIILISLPAFRFLSGGRSIEGATNVMSATLARARTEAIGVQRVKGVAFFRETQSGRAAAALVEQKSPRLWADGASYSEGDWAYVATATPGVNNYYVCQQSHTAAPGNRPGTSGGNTYWRACSSAINTAVSNGQLVIDVVPDRDRALLPVGIGVVGAGEAVGGSTYTIDRPAVILFDGNGMLAPRAYALSAASVLAQTFGLSTDDTRQAQVALMLFDIEEYSAKAVDTASANTFLTESGSPLYVNRYNGTIVKGE